jgi:hypothetical protein
MGGLIHCSTVRYAIIQASSKKNDPERLVIAYPDEKCLRDLIAAPSIVGFGFTSREEAMELLRRHAGPESYQARGSPHFYVVQAGR